MPIMQHYNTHGMLIRTTNEVSTYDRALERRNRLIERLERENEDLRLRLKELFEKYSTELDILAKK